MRPIWVVFPKPAGSLPSRVDMIHRRKSGQTPFASWGRLCGDAQISPLSLGEGISDTITTCSTLCQVQTFTLAQAHQGRARNETIRKQWAPHVAILRVTVKSFHKQEHPHSCQWATQDLPNHPPDSTFELGDITSKSRFTGPVFPLASWRKRCRWHTRTTHHAGYLEFVSQRVESWKDCRSQETARVNPETSHHTALHAWIVQGIMFRT